MLHRVLIQILFFVVLTAQAQNICTNISCLTVDDKPGGYVLASYKIPEDGKYVFSIEGALLPKEPCTIYYYEYYLALESRHRKYLQDTYNIGSQAQDGNTCFFNTHEKSNSVEGMFSRDEVVELRIVLLKSDVNGQPHRKIRLTKNTLLRVEKRTDLAGTSQH